MLCLLGACSTTQEPAVPDEQRANADLDAQVSQRLGIYQQEYLTRYVDSVGRRLAARYRDSEFRFRFQVLDQPGINIFSSPGGYIYISRGLLTLVDSEDELAGLIAHQIAHITQRHASPVAGLGSRSTPAAMELPSDRVAEVVGADLAGLMTISIDAAGQLAVPPYSLAQESEADRLALEMSAKSGYDPAGLGLLLSRMDKASSLLEAEGAAYGFAGTHPSPPGRLAGLSDQAGEIQWTAGKPFAETRRQFLNRFDGLLWGPDNPSQGLFRGQTFQQPFMNFQITFPEDWRTVNTSNYVGAVTESQDALSVLGSAPRTMNPKLPADAFAVKLQEEADLAPAESREVKVGDWPAYLLRYDDPSGVQPVSIYSLWVASPGLTFRLIGVGPDNYRQAMADAALSLRSLTPAEREQVTGNRLRLVTTRPDENLSALSERINNVWSDELTVIINNLSDAETLQPDQLIKIVRAEGY